MKSIKDDKTLSLNLILRLRGHWFDLIKSGEKTHEYRVKKPYWETRINNWLYRNKTTYSYRNINGDKTYITQEPYWFNNFYVEIENPPLVSFFHGYSNEKMIFEVKNISTVNGLNTDLRYPGDVFDIELGKRIE